MRPSTAGHIISKERGCKTRTTTVMPDEATRFAAMYKPGSLGGSLGGASTEQLVLAFAAFDRERVFPLYHLAWVDLGPAIGPDHYLSCLALYISLHGGKVIGDIQYTRVERTAVHCQVSRCIDHRECRAV